MKRASILVFCTIFVAMLVAAPSVQAAGFALYEWGNRSIAMATAGYTKAADASVVALNPSLMTQLDGAHAMGGFALITPSSDLNVDGQDTSTKDKTFVVPHAYYTHQLSDDWWLGLGVYTRFGLGTYYPNGWPGKDEFQYVDLQSQSFTPTIAYKVNDDFSVAIGLEVLKGGIALENVVLGGKYEAQTEGYAIGGNLSANYQISDEFAAGFVYRAPMRMSTRGTADLGVAGKVDADQKIVSTLPSSYTLGLSWEPNEKWLIEFDTIFTRWSLTDRMQYDGALRADHVLNYKDSWRFQLGTEYWLNEKVAVRAGYVYDITPTRANDASYMLPANDRHLFSGGLGFKSGNWTIDWSLMYVVTKERYNLSIGSDNVDFKNGRTLVTGMSLGYAF